MKEDINFESIAKHYKCAVAGKYRPLKPEEINSIPLGNNLVSRKIDGELWLAYIWKEGAIWDKGKVEACCSSHALEQLVSLHDPENKMTPTSIAMFLEPCLDSKIVDAIKNWMCDDEEHNEEVKKTARMCSMM